MRRDRYRWFLPWKKVGEALRMDACYKPQRTTVSDKRARKPVGVRMRGYKYRRMNDCLRPTGFLAHSGITIHNGVACRVG